MSPVPASRTGCQRIRALIADGRHFAIWPTRRSAAPDSPESSSRTRTLFPGGQFEGHLTARFGSWDLFWRISPELWHATFLILKSYKVRVNSCHDSWQDPTVFSQLMM
jgi:hypothetical protein